MKRILIACTNREASASVRDCLESKYHVETVADRDSCMARIAGRRYEYVFIDLPILLSGNDFKNWLDYKEVLRPFWNMAPALQIIVLADQSRLRAAVDAVKAGASNYLTYPINQDELRFVMESLYESFVKQSELDYLRDRFWDNESLDVIRTRSPEMRSVFRKVKSVVRTRTTVLLLGETGTGKGVIAKLIHQHSNRSNRPFIAVHCGAIPDTLLESELFGHEKGAFTGAIRRKLGKFEIAHNGTIFLDEVSTVTPSAQIKLLNVLQDRKFQRVGGEEDIEVDVRIIAATNEDLKEKCRAGAFRNDLFYRLNVFPIVIPPLRERREDIMILADVFLKRLNKLYSKNIYDVHPQVAAALQAYSWPGNVRELENVIERAHILESSSILMPESFPREFFESGNHAAHIHLNTALSLAEVRRQSIEAVEKRYIKDLLSEHEGRINDTARAAGISVRQLHKKMTRYGIRKEDFKPAKKSRA